MAKRRCLGYHNLMATQAMTTPAVGNLLREWRQRRRMSQLDLAFEADVSSKHLSFVETGRAAPSREMILHLAEQLEVPLRDRNTLLAAAGYAPIFPERTLEDPDLQAAKAAIDLILKGHEPYPALAVDRHWTLLAANAAFGSLLAGVHPALLKPPVNVLRLTLHPDGLAPRIVNLAQCRSHLLARLWHQAQATADPILGDLWTELSDFPAPPASQGHEEDFGGVLVPVRLRTEYGILSLFSTTTVFGTARDVTLSEIALESFFPADAFSSAILNSLVDVPAPFPV